VLKNVLKWHDFTPASVHPSTPIQVSQEETPTKTFMELSPPPKLSNSGSSRVTRSLHREVLTSSPIIYKKKLKAKHMKNNFKKMVHNPNSSNSDKNDGSGCCKECKEYYCVTKEECDWIKCSFCKKVGALHNFSKSCLDCGRIIRSKNLTKT
jgi:hypothetical protein